MRDNYRRGFLLIDVLIAAAIIGFIALPVTAGLSNSVSSAAYARNVYKASLYANNFVTELENGIKTGVITEASLEENENVLDGLKTFFDEDVYDYSAIIDIYDRNGNTHSIKYTTNPQFESMVSGVSLVGFPDDFFADLTEVGEESVMEFRGGGASTIIGYYGKRERKMYVPAVEIFDKSGRSLTYKVKPVLS